MAMLHRFPLWNWWLAHKRNRSRRGQRPQVLLFGTRCFSCLRGLGCDFGSCARVFLFLLTFAAVFCPHMYGRNVLCALVLHS